MKSRKARNLVPIIAAAGLIAATAPLSIVEYQIPRPQAFPHDPAVGPDGIVWYTDQQNSFIGRLDPATGKITDYPTPTPASGPHGIIVAPDGGVWYTANRIGKIARLDPKSGQIKEFELGAGARDPHTPLFRKGMIWFTVQQSNMIGRLDPATGQNEAWKAGESRALPYGMVNAPDGSIWVALFGTNKLGRIDADAPRVTAGPMREISLPEPGARPRRLVVASDGVVFYSDFARGRLGSYDPKTGTAKEWLSAGGATSAPYGIAVAPDGRIVYDEARTGNIVVFDRKTEKMETIKIPTPGSIVRNISVDSTRGRVWLALSGIGRIGRIDLR